MANTKSKDKGLSKEKKSKPVANRNQFDELITDCDQLVDDKDIIISQRDIEELILVIRGHQVLIDRDLAMIYGVETRSLNQAVKRNIRRFPERYRFQLTKDVDAKGQVTGMIMPMTCPCGIRTVSQKSKFIGENFVYSYIRGTEHLIY